METRLAIVTGASAGIGRELALQLAARGYNLLLVARRKERLQVLAEKVARDTGREAGCLPLNLTQRADRKVLIARMEQESCRLALVVNNAGFGAVGVSVRTPFDRYAEMIELNISALTEISLAAAQIFIHKGSGAIINVASTASFQAVPYLNVYSATKAYVLSFTEGLAEEIGKRGVRVMALCPGITRTEFQRIAGAPEDGFRMRHAMSAADCARIGLDDFERGKRVSITGLSNRIQVCVSRLLPRGLVVRMIGKAMKSRA